MNRTAFPILLSAILVVLATTVVSVPGATAADKERVIHRFKAEQAEKFSEASLIFDSAGNLYGATTGLEGVQNASVFELTPTSSGHWNEKILYLTDNCSGAIYRAVTFDSAGNLWGANGGGGDCNAGGYVFELRPRSHGRWKERTIRPFYGECPNGPLLWDAAGNLYGTSNGCYDGENGTVFELTPKVGAGWKVSVLARISRPNQLIFDKVGNIYGTTYTSVFKLTRKSNGKWKETTLYSFGVGSTFAGVVFDPAGNLYGTTFTGGTYGFGTVFELTPTSGDNWNVSVLYNFKGGNDGETPYASVAFDQSGNLYGTTVNGGLTGSYCGGSTCGTVFKLTPTSGGRWRESIVHRFRGSEDGANPYTGVIFDKAGNLYGTTKGGGDAGFGTVFEITP
jgi:uncharacterized repeat protein (TIGR03803 family)